MRTISVTTEVFALIWAARRPPEETESEILTRILNGSTVTQVGQDYPNGVIGNVSAEVKTSDAERLIGVDSTKGDAMFGKVRWVDDVRSALVTLGGKASLHSIYKEVERIRKGAGRSIPKTLDAVIRRTLEDHSSDSANFRGADLFALSEGHGKGIWQIRQTAK